MSLHTLTIEGPAKNALGSKLMTSLTRELQEADGQPVLLTGAGDAFSAGLNLKELATLDAAGMRDFLHLLEGLLETVYTYPGPLVAAVNGHAIAGGCLLALFCDHRVGPAGSAMAGAKIGLNEVRLGLRFPPRILALLRRRMDPAALEAVVLGSALHAPREALAHGLLDALADNPVAAARAQLEVLASLPPAAYRATKAQLRGTVPEISKAEQEHFETEVLPVWASEELKARIGALLGGRTS